MGRKAAKRRAASLDFEVVIDAAGECNLHKHGLGPSSRGVGMLNDRTLAAVAEELAKFENKERIRVLDLSQNQVSKLPDKLQRLHRLEVLVLDCNKLHSIPHWIADLSSLRELWLQDNPLSGPNCLPRQLEELTQLRRLVVDAPLEKQARQVLELCQNQRDAEFERLHGYPPSQAKNMVAAASELHTDRVANDLQKARLLLAKAQASEDSTEITAARKRLEEAESSYAKQLTATAQFNANPKRVKGSMMCSVM